MENCQVFVTMFSKSFATELLYVGYTKSLDKVVTQEAPTQCILISYLTLEGVFTDT